MLSFRRSPLTRSSALDPAGGSAPSAPLYDHYMITLSDRYMSPQFSEEVFAYVDDVHFLTIIRLVLEFGTASPFILT